MIFWYIVDDFVERAERWKLSLWKIEVKQKEVTHCWEPNAGNSIFKKQINDSFVKQKAADFLKHSKDQSTDWQSGNNTLETKHLYSTYICKVVWHISFKIAVFLSCLRTSKVIECTSTLKKKKKQYFFKWISGSCKKESWKASHTEQLNT